MHAAQHGAWRQPGCRDNVYVLWMQTPVAQALLAKAGIHLQVKYGKTRGEELHRPLALQLRAEAEAEEAKGGTKTLTKRVYVWNTFSVQTAAHTRGGKAALRPLTKISRISIIEQFLGSNFVLYWEVSRFHLLHP